MSSDVSFFMWYTAGAVMFGSGYGYGDDCRDGDFESDTPPHF